MSRQLDGLQPSSNVRAMVLDPEPRRYTFVLVRGVGVGEAAADRDAPGVSDGDPVAVGAGVGVELAVGLGVAVACVGVTSGVGVAAAAGAAWSVGGEAPAQTAVPAEDRVMATASSTLGRRPYIISIRSLPSRPQILQGRAGLNGRRRTEGSLRLCPQVGSPGPPQTRPSL